MDNAFLTSTRQVTNAEWKKQLRLYVICIMAVNTATHEHSIHICPHVRARRELLLQYSDIHIAYNYIYGMLIIIGYGAQRTCYEIMTIFVPLFVFKPNDICCRMW
jgi:hypothetical protein